MKNLDIIEQYVEAAAPSGYEKEAFTVMNNHLKDSCDEIVRDNLGSLIASRVVDEQLPNVMIAGHLDEIGFMVTKIDDNGYIKFQPLGGWWGQVMLAQKMDLVDSSGKRHLGVIGAKPPHVLTPEERSKPVDIKNMFLDLGVASKEEVVNLGIKIGDFIVPHCGFSTMGNEKYLLAKAFDNRIGCYIAAEVMIRLKNDNLNCNLFAVGSVQEEVGCRGAKTASSIVNPDIGFSLDVGLAADMPGSENETFPTKLGDGPLISLFDATMIGHRGLREFVIDVADENQIKYQFAGLTGGGTDAGMMHVNGAGAPSLYVGLATRYIHSNVSIIHYDDIEGAIELLVATIKKLDKESVSSITYN